MLSLWKSTELLAVIYIKAFPDIAATVKTRPFLLYHSASCRGSYFGGEGGYQLERERGSLGINVVPKENLSNTLWLIPLLSQLPAEKSLQEPSKTT